MIAHLEDSEQLQLIGNVSRKYRIVKVAFKNHWRIIRRRLLGRYREEWGSYETSASSRKESYRVDRDVDPSRTDDNLFRNRSLHCGGDRRPGRGQGADPWPGAGVMEIDNHRT